MAKSIESFEATSPTAEVVSALRRDGGVILKRLVAESIMDQIYEEATNASTEKAQEASGSAVWPEGNKTLGGLAALSPTFAEKLILHPKTLEVADAILLPQIPMAPSAAKVRKGADEELDEVYEGPHSRTVENDAGSKQVIMRRTDAESGPNCHHYNLGASVMLEIHKGSENQILHRENGIYQPYVEHMSDMREFIVSVNWAGTDFTMNNGATRLVPGSHRWPEERVAKEDEIVQAPMPKGSAVIWLSRVLHGAGASAVDGGRTAFFNSYISDWVRQEENQYITVTPEIAGKLSERAQQIVGYRAGPTLGWVKGRDRENLLQEGKSNIL